jgi:glucose/arabinose dehydrogenase
MRSLFLLSAFTFMLLSANSEFRPEIAVSEQTSGYQLSFAFPELEFEMPVELVSPEDNTNRAFVVEQSGRIMSFVNKPDAKNATIFLDIVKNVDSGGEKGLLGLAFHPDFKSNGFFYVNYTRSSPLETVVSRFKANGASPQTADPKSEQVLLHFRQPYSNHNGGKIAFGKDGFLYISTGDGGSGGDPHNNGQDRTSWLGKILRINVDKPAGGKKYSIPSDNPFRGNEEGYLEEIYAYGLRNVWRFNFDDETGQLWAGDVGQNKIEEVDIIEKGGNYGWRIMEGEECFKPRDCKKENLILPIWSYHQGSSTGRSVTGGYVCRDKNLPALNGKYIYGDFVSGNIWALTFSGNRATKNELIASLPDGLSSFGEDSRKNLYVLSYGSGKIYSITAK